MPIKVQSGLPAKAILESEFIFIMDEERAMTQDIRPLQIAILNLMPNKEETETHLLRALSNTPLQLEVTFLAMESRVSKHTAVEHLNKFYKSYREVKEQRFDGLIIKGIYGRQMHETWYKMSAMLQGGLNISNIITHRMDVRSFEEGFAAMNSGKSGKVILDWTTLD